MTTRRQREMDRGVYRSASQKLNPHFSSIHFPENAAARPHGPVRIGSSVGSGQGLFATAVIPPDAVVLTVPAACVLRPKDACARAGVTFAAAFAVASAECQGVDSDAALLALLLLRERALGAASPWSEYLASVPACYTNVWLDAERGAIPEGCEVAQAAFLRVGDVRDLWERLHAAQAFAVLAPDGGAAGTTWDEWCWAVSSVESRAFKHVDPSHPHTQVEQFMLPLADFCNHSLTPNVTRMVRTPDGDVVFLAGRKGLEAGDEVCITYGNAPDNGALLLQYGFAIEENPADMLLLALRLPEEDAEGAEEESTDDRDCMVEVNTRKLAFLSAFQLGLEHKLSRDVAAEAPCLLCALRVLLLPCRDFQDVWASFHAAREDDDAKTWAEPLFAPLHTPPPVVTLQAHMRAPVPLPHAVLPEGHDANVSAVLTSLLCDALPRDPSMDAMAPAMYAPYLRGRKAVLRAWQAYIYCSALPQERESE
jgi:hypothetical protein